MSPTTGERQGNETVFALEPNFQPMEAKAGTHQGLSLFNCVAWLGGIGIVTAIILWLPAQVVDPVFPFIGEIAATSWLWIRWSIIGFLWMSVIMSFTISHEKGGPNRLGYFQLNPFWMRVFWGALVLAVLSIKMLD